MIPMTSGPFPRNKRLKYVDLVGLQWGNQSQKWVTKIVQCLGKILASSGLEASSLYCKLSTGSGLWHSVILQVCHKAISERGWIAHPVRSRQHVSTC